IEDLTRTIWGPQGLPLEVPDVINSPISADLFFITGYRLFVVGVTAIAAIGLYLLLRYTLLGIRIRAGTSDLETTSALGVNIYKLRAFNFGFGCFFAGLSGVLAAGILGLTPPMGDSLIMPSFVAIIVGGVGSLYGAVLGGLIIGVAAGITTTYYPAASEAVIYLILLIVLAARTRWRRGPVRVKHAATRPLLIAVMWAALIALPWWLPMIGGYTALGSKVLIYAMATMGLNLLLGFTGGLSFGQAAYFGLGAY